jgi:hypothetical protein
MPRNDSKLTTQSRALEAVILAMISNLSANGVERGRVRMKPWGREQAEVKARGPQQEWMGKPDIHGSHL